MHRIISVLPPQKLNCMQRIGTNLRTTSAKLCSSANLHMKATAHIVRPFVCKTVFPYIVGPNDFWLLCRQVLRQISQCCWVGFSHELIHTACVRGSLFRRRFCVWSAIQPRHPVPSSNFPGKFRTILSSAAFGCSARCPSGHFAVCSVIVITWSSLQQHTFRGEMN